jgi:hypothetical protein
MKFYRASVTVATKTRRKKAASDRTTNAGGSEFTGIAPAAGILTNELRGSILVSLGEFLRLLFLGGKLWFICFALRVLFFVCHD